MCQKELPPLGVFDLFSKRQKRLRGEVPDVYVYDELPPPLKVQLVQIIQDAIGAEDRYRDNENRLYSEIHKVLCREYGVFSLSKNPNSTPFDAIANYFLQTPEVEHAIDIAELCLRVIDTQVRENPYIYKYRAADPDPSIDEANRRFKEHGIGFEYISGEIIRIDSQVIHADVVKPTLKLLSNVKYKGANEEFLKAHEHHRHGRQKECLAECLKAFESTMKSICDSQGWTYDKRDTAKSLIDICMNNGLFPTFLQTHIGNLRSILESGVPTVRNKLGGHGQGSSVVPVSAETAQFALHTTATNILFFAQAAEALP